MHTYAPPIEAAWSAMVAHSAIAARTTGDERSAARLAARAAYLKFQKMRALDDRISRTIKGS